MAVTLTSAPSGDYLTTGKKNILNFLFNASASETWLQLRINDGTTDYELIPVPFVGGVATVDLCPYLSALLSNDDTTVNSRLSVVGDYPTVDVTLEQRNSGSGTYASIGSIYTAVNAARQTGESPNLDDYQATADGSGNITSEGSFLTLRDRPKVFWYSDSQTPTTASDVSAWSQQIGFLNPYSDPLRSLNVQRRYYKGGTLEATVNSTAGYNEEVFIYALNNLNNVFNADRLELEITDVTTGDTIVDKVFDVVRACSNPIAVKWLNTLGVFETYVFEGNAPTTADINDNGVFNIPVTSLATTTELSRPIENVRNDEIEVFADNLTYNEAEALQEIYTSPIVLLYVGNLENNIAFDKWQGVLASGDSTLDKRLSKQSFRCTLRKGEYLTQRS